MLETGSVSSHINDVRNVIVVLSGESHQQTSVEPESPVTSRIEWKDLSNRPDRWYNGNDGAVETSITPLAA
jgi:hypothetical protein